MKYRTLLAAAISAVMVLSGCNTDKPAETSATAEEVTTSTTAEVTTTAESTTSSTTTAKTTTTTTADPDPAETPVLSIDLNNDGIDEEFYIEEDHYRIVMHTEAGDKTTETLGFPNRFFIYRNDDGVYCYSYVESGNDDSFSQHNFTVLDDGFFFWQAFGKSCSTGSRLTFWQYADPCTRAEFDSAFTDPLYLASETPEAHIEYIGTLDIDELVNKNRKEHLVKTIDTGIGIPVIDIYELENDVFGRRYKFCCGDKTVFIDDYEKMTVYARFPKITQEGDRKQQGEPMIGTEREFLLCLETNTTSTADTIYIGYPSECYFVHYGKSGDKKKSVADITINDGWTQYSASENIFATYIDNIDQRLDLNLESTAAAYSGYGEGMDIIAGKETVLAFCVDEEAFEEPQALQKARERLYAYFPDEIEQYNGGYAGTFDAYSDTPVTCAEELPFIKGLHFDADSDGTDELAVMIGITTWQCALYFIDGNDKTQISPWGLDDSGLLFSGIDMSLWDFGQYRFVSYTWHAVNWAQSDIYRITDGRAPEYVYSSYYGHRFAENGFVWVNSASRYEIHLPQFIVCTADGELKEIGEEDVSLDIFLDIAGNDPQMKAAIEDFGLELDKVTAVRTRGYLEFVLFTEQEIPRHNKVMIVPGKVEEAFNFFDYVPDEYDENALYGINMYKVNFS